MLNKGCKKYIPFAPVSLPDRTWPDKVIEKPPVWCSVDLRDGNQALIDPMNLEEKLLFFQTLVDIGFKEIEIGFPSASETEYEICRTLIERNLIPDDVTIQVLVQCRPHLIKRTFEAIDGAKNVIVHFYNSTSTLQRKVVFHTDMQGVIDIAVEGAKLVRELTEKEIARTGANIRYEYSPESFSGTEMDNAVLICEKVLETLGATPEKKVILNLPNTVEMATPNCHADQIEYFCRHLKHRDCAIISLHPHNDRGTGTAATELGIMAGAEARRGHAVRQRRAHRQRRYHERRAQHVFAGRGSGTRLLGYPPHPRNLREVHEDAGAAALSLCRRPRVHGLLRLASGRHQQGRAVHGTERQSLLGGAVSADRSG